MNFKKFFVAYALTLINYICQAQASAVDSDRPGKAFHFPVNTEQNLTLPPSITGREILSKSSFSRVYFHDDLTAFSQLYFTGTGEIDETSALEESQSLIRSYISKNSLLMSIDNCRVYQIPYDIMPIFINSNYVSSLSTVYRKSASMTNTQRSDRSDTKYSYAIVQCHLQFTRTDIDTVYLENEEDDEVLLLSTTKAKPRFLGGTIRLTETSSRPYITLMFSIASSESDEVTASTKKAATRYMIRSLSKMRSKGLTVTTCKEPVLKKKIKLQFYFEMICELEHVNVLLFRSLTNKSIDTGNYASTESFNFNNMYSRLVHRIRTIFLTVRAAERDLSLVGQVDKKGLTAIASLKMDGVKEISEIDGPLRSHAVKQGKSLINIDLRVSDKYRHMRVAKRCRFRGLGVKWRRDVLEVSCPLHRSQ